MRALLYSLFLLATVWPVLAEAQNTQSFELYGRADIAYRELSAKAAWAESFKESFNDIETVALLPAVGLRYRLGLNPRHSVALGLSLSQMGYNQRARDLTWGSQWNGTVFDPTLPGENLRFVGERYSYLTTAMTYAYTLTRPGAKLAIQLSGGIESGLLLSSRTVIARDGQRESQRIEARDYRQFNIGFLSSVMLQRRMSQRLTLFAEPTFRHQLTAIEANFIQGRLWTAGLALGAAWKI